MSSSGNHKSLITSEDGDLMKGRIAMSTKDLNRLEVLTKLKERRLRQGEAARVLGVTPRQVRRLVKRLEKEGPGGLISRKVGAPSNNRRDPEKTSQILAFCSQKNHYDFGPTLVQEYLCKEGSQKFSISSIRNVMIQNGLWLPKKVRELKVHPLRPRRLQYDGGQWPEQCLRDQSDECSGGGR